MMHPGGRILERYADGMVPERRRATVARHLLTCLRCRAELEALVAVRAAVSPPVPSPDLLSRILRRRAAGERVLLPTSWPRPARRVARAAGLVAAGALAIAVVSVIPAGSGVNGASEEVCMAGWRSLLPVFVLGSGVACADTVTPFELPDDAFVQVSEVDGTDLLPGRYVYETVMWTDNIVESPQREQEISLAAGTFQGAAAWETHTTTDYRYVGGRYRVRRSGRAWFGMADLAPLRFESQWSNEDLMVMDVTADSVLRQWASDGQWLKSSHVRTGGLFFAPFWTFSYAHAAAVVASLPLSDRWAGTVGGRAMAVVAREDITVPAGTFTCWRIEAPEVKADELRSRRAEWRAWVAVDRPLVIRTETGPVAERWETRLVSFEPESD